ncbi:MAG: hypothetical protein JWP51_1099 [Bradyrhizobium sp.]|jgi:hypothetical protein|nr:hypothetical protein [Bradyrhizobium sp.]
MITLLRKTLIPLAVAACFTVGNSVAIAQVAEKQDQQENAAFKGIHRNRGINGRPNTVTITDGKAYVHVTEQEYRQRGYTPAVDELPVLIIQRIPVQIPVPQEHAK